MPAEGRHKLNVILHHNQKPVIQRDVPHPTPANSAKGGRLGPQQQRKGAWGGRHGLLRKYAHLTAQQI